MKISKAKFFSKVGYFPHAVQQAIHDSQARFRIVAAGARSGKSMLAGAEIAFALLKPDCRIWCVGTQYELAEKEFVWAVRFLSQFEINGKRLIDYCRVSMAAKGSQVLSFPGLGSYVKTKSTEKTQSLLGEELDLVVLCEAGQHARAPWDRILRERIGPRQGGLIACSTPNADGGLFHDFFKKAENTHDWARWQFSTLANPYFPRAEYELARGELAKPVFEEQYEGLFVSRKGKVFDLCEANVTDVEPAEDLPVLVGLHYRSNNPVAVVFVAYALKTRSYLVHGEIYNEKSTAVELVVEIREKVRGRRFLGVFVDFWDAALQRELKQKGLPVGLNRAEKEIGRQISQIRRIQAVQNALKIRPDGSTRLKIMRRCENTLRDFERAKWPDRRGEEEEKAEQELPLSKFLFCPLALSYVVSFCESAGGIDLYGAQARGDKDESSDR